MTDAELIARLRKADEYEPLGYDGWEAADRLEQLAVTNEALTKERDQHWDSFVHWRKEADDRSEQLSAARQDADEAEAYAEELEAKLATCEKYRDAYAECDRIGTQAVRDLETKLAKAVEALGHIAAEASVPVHTWRNGINFKKMYGGWRKIAVERIDKARATLAEIKGESHE